jgi:serine/threonine protein phosphatase PrpC
MIQHERAVKFDFHTGPETTINAALRDACLQCDAAFLATNPANRAGSTACALLVFGQQHMVCANVGDSRCCLATESACVQLSEDQTPARADEAQPIPVRKFDPPDAIDAASTQAHTGRRRLRDS